MKEVTIGAKTRDPERHVEVTFHEPETLAEAAEAWGEKVVLNRCLAAVTIDVQAKMRSHMVDKTDKEGNVTSQAKSDEEISTLISNWKPGERQITRKTPKEKLRDLLSGLSEEQRAALLASVAEEMEAAA